MHTSRSLSASRPVLRTSFSLFYPVRRQRAYLAVFVNARSLGIVRLLYKHVNLSRRCHSGKRATRRQRRNGERASERGWGEQWRGGGRTGLPVSAVFRVSRHAAYLAFHQPRPFYATQVWHAPARRASSTEMGFRHLSFLSRVGELIFFRSWRGGTLFHPHPCTRALFPSVPGKMNLLWKGRFWV